MHSPVVKPIRLKRNTGNLRHAADMKHLLTSSRVGSGGGLIVGLDPSKGLEYLGRLFAVFRFGLLNKTFPKTRVFQYASDVQKVNRFHDVVRLHSRQNDIEIAFGVLKDRTFSSPAEVVGFYRLGLPAKPFKFLAQLSVGDFMTHV